METEPIDVWPPKPTVTTDVVEVGNFRLWETSECLTVQDTASKRKFLIQFGFMISLEFLAAIFQVLLLLLLSNFQRTAFDALRTLIFQLIAIRCVGLLIMYWMSKKKSDNMSEPIDLDRGQNDLRIHKKKAGSLSNLRSLEIKRSFGSWSLTAVTANPRNLTKDRRLFVISDKKKGILWEVAQAIADFAGVPVRDKSRKC